MFIKKRWFENELSYLHQKLDFLKLEIYSQKIIQGNLLARLNESKTDQIIENIHLAEFKVFSQWGDDGIIQFLINYLDIETKTFIEFGVQDYTEANTRFLLVNNNWTGLIMDGNAENIEKVKREDIYWKHALSAAAHFVTAENINELIGGHGFTEEIGLLHIDIDGNDYWVWKAITCISPVIAILEYNSVFGADNSWTIPYKADFLRTKAHYSNLYFGCSLNSLCQLAAEKGYSFIGCNSHGNNAYFIRNDKMNGLKPLDAKIGYVLSKFRESRDAAGNMTYINGPSRLKEIAGLEVYDTVSNQTTTIP